MTERTYSEDEGFTDAEVSAFFGGEYDHLTCAELRERLNKSKHNYREGEVICIKERTGYFTHHSEPMYWRVPAEWASVPDSARPLNHSELPSYVHDLVDAVLKAELMACSEGYSYGEIHKLIYEALTAYRKESGYE